MERSLKELIRMERFEDIYQRFEKKIIGCEDAADLLGCSVRHFHRLRKGFESQGIENLRDKRINARAHNKAADEETEMVTKLYNDKYQGFSVKHFHEFLELEHGLHRSYSWTRNTLSSAQLVRPAKRGGAHRLRRPRKPMIGMMIHQDASSHEWIPDQIWDLIVTMDDSTSEIYSAFFCDEEGTASSMQGIREVIDKQGLFCSFYTDRGSHYFYTAEAGGKVDKSRPTQVGRALKQLNIRHIAAYSPQARGRSERMFGTLQGRLPQEFALKNITDMAAANRYLSEVYLPKHNKNFTIQPESEQSAFMPTVGLDIENILCIQEERTVGKDNTVRYNSKILQIPKNEFRNHFIKAKVQVNQYINGEISLFYGPMCIGEYNEDGAVKKQSVTTKKAA